MIAAVVLAVVIAASISTYFAAERRRRVPWLAKLVATLSHALLMQMNEKPKLLERELIKGDPAVWRQLDDREREWLVNTLDVQQDIGPSWKEDVMTDRWGHSMRIEVRRPPERLEFRITSAGPDRVFGTPDDIGCTTEEGAPRRLAER